MSRVVNETANIAWHILRSSRLSGKVGLKLQKNLKFCVFLKPNCASTWITSFGFTCAVYKHSKDKCSSFSPRKQSLDASASSSALDLPTQPVRKLSACQLGSTGLGSTADESRCKVCFKVIGDQEFFRVCSVCVKRVCEDCSASYSKEEPVYGKVWWKLYWVATKG